MAGAFEPELAQVTSNDLQASVRSLLPSVSGFGSRLGAQNVIVPIVDLTPTAEGSVLRPDLQEAINYGGAIAIRVVNTTSTVLNTAGFWRVTVEYTNFPITSGSGSDQATIVLTDGVTPITIFETFSVKSQGTSVQELLDFKVFLAEGISMEMTTNSTQQLFAGSARQLADVNGELINPVGFTSL